MAENKTKEAAYTIHTSIPPLLAELNTFYTDETSSDYEEDSEGERVEIQALSDNFEEVETSDVETLNLINKRKKCRVFIEQLEEILEKVKDRYYDKQIDELDRTQESIESGTYPKLKEHEEELQRKRDERLDILSVEYKYELEHIEKKFEANEKLIQNTFFNDKKDLKTRLLNRAYGKIFQLKKEYNELNLRAKQFEGKHEENNVLSFETNLLAIDDRGAPLIPPLTHEEIDQDINEIMITLNSSNSNGIKIKYHEEDQYDGEPVSKKHRN